MISKELESDEEEGEQTSLTTENLQFSWASQHLRILHASTDYKYIYLLYI